MRTLCIALLTLALALPGCSWVGKTAGKAKAKIEQGAEDLNSGYDQGYEEEKQKSEPEQAT